MGEPPVEGIKWNLRQRFRARQWIETAKQAMELNPDVASTFNLHPDIIVMRSPYTVVFQEIFSMGYQNYSQGEWKCAERLLSRTRTQLGCEDGPSAALLRFMREPYNFEAPPKWKGV